MNSANSLLVAALWLLASPGDASAAHPGEGAGRALNLEAEFEPWPSPAPLGVPVLVRLTLRNVGDEGMAVDLGPHREAAFRFEALTPGGDTEPGNWKMRGGPSAPGRVYLEPGDVYGQDLILARWLDLDRPGGYEITAGIKAEVFQGVDTNSPFYEDGWKVGVFEDERRMTLEVEEEPEQAAEACAALAEKALDRSGEVALPALEALTFVSSPACIPVLKKVALEAHQAPHQAVEGIARIGGSAALDALLEILPDVGARSLPHVGRHLRAFCPEHRDRVSPALHDAGQPGCEASRESGH